MSQTNFDLPHTPPDLSLQALAWLYSLARDCGGLRTLVNSNYFTDDDVALGLGAQRTESALKPERSTRPIGFVH